MYIVHVLYYRRYQTTIGRLNVEFFKSLIVTNVERIKNDGLVEAGFNPRITAVKPRVYYR